MEVGFKFLLYTYDQENKKRQVYIITLFTIHGGVQFNIYRWLLGTRLRKKVTLKYVTPREADHLCNYIGYFRVMITSKVWNNLYTWIINKDFKSIFQLLSTQHLIKGKLKFSEFIQDVIC